MGLSGKENDLSATEPDELAFETHLRRVEPFILGKNEENDVYIEREAQTNHALAVDMEFQNVRERFFALIYDDVLPQLARDQVQFGITRRLLMLWYSFRRIRSTVPADRTTPLAFEQGHATGIDLNSIYINLYGAIDNFAWFLVHAACRPELAAASPARINLFKPPFSEDENILDLATEIQQFSRWYAELSERRHPSAHRFPLYIPRAAMTADDLREFDNLQKEQMMAIAEQKFETLDSLRARQQRIGTFISQFMHDGRLGSYPIYPTIPNDIGVLMKIGRAVLRFVENRRHKGDLARADEL